MGKKSGKFASFSRRECQNIPSVFVILLLLKYLLTYLTGKTNADSGKFWTLFEILKPLAIVVIGALTLSVLLSLVATPTVYFVMRTVSPAKSARTIFPDHR
ncbi:MAG: hypothetical protein ACXVA0_24640 [Mucilaginibacter sp.]